MSENFAFEVIKIVAIVAMVTVAISPVIIAENNKKYCVTNFKNIGDVENCINMIK